MVNFEKLVESVMLKENENAPAASNGSTENKAQSNDSDKSYTFFTTPIDKLSNKSPYKAFEEKYKEIYGGRPPLTDEGALKTLLATIKLSADKNQLVVDGFKNYVEAFPLIDFVLYVVAAGSGQNKALFNNFEKALDQGTIDNALAAVSSYLNDFKDNAVPDSWPLDYAAQSVQARMLQAGLRKMLTTNVIGELAFDKFLRDPNSNIYSTVIGLLAPRRKIRDPLNYVPQENAYINDIIYGDYQKYAGGGELVKGKYARLYTQTTVQSLVGLGKAIRSYYENQLGQYGGEDPSTIKKFKEDPKMLEAFVKNSLNGKPFTWVQSTEASSQAPAERNESVRTEFSTLVGFLNKHILSEWGLPDSLKDEYNKFQRNKQPSNTNEPVSPTTYNIDTINKQASSGNDAAKALITQLKQIGDFIKEGEPLNLRDIVKKAGSAAEGARLGAKFF